MTEVAVAHHATRITSMEDLLRRNEGSITAILGRLKDVELALNSVHRITGKFQPEMATMSDDLEVLRRKVDTVDHTWRSKAQEIDSVIQQEVINNRPPPLNSEPTFMRAMSDIQILKQDNLDSQASQKRLGEALAMDEKSIKQVEQDGKWLLEQFRDQVAQNREFTQSQLRRNEQMIQDINDCNNQRERGQSQLQTLIDGVVKQLRDELAVKFEAEAKARIALQNDIVQAFAKMREDVVKGFAQTATNLRNLDETGHSLETVLRAEVRSRMLSQEDVLKRMDTVEVRVKREASSAAEYLKSLDSQMSGALKDVREITASECRSQLERAWRSIDESRTRLDDIERGSAGQSAGNSEVSIRRQQLQLDTEMTKMKNDILEQVERRMNTSGGGVGHSEKMASKSDLKNESENLEMKIDQLRNEFARKESQNASNQLIKFETQVANLDTRVEESERNVKAVADTLQAAQRDLSDKIDTMGVHAKAIDTLQKNLQSSWERDQAQMESILLGMREQVMLLAEEHPEGASGEDGEGVKEKVSKAQVSLLDKDVQDLREQQRHGHGELLREIQELKVAVSEQKMHVDHSAQHVKDEMNATVDDMKDHVKKELRKREDTTPVPPEKESTPSSPAADTKLQEEMSSLRTGHSELTAKVSKLEDQFADVSALKTDVTTLQDTVKDLSSRAESTAQEMSKLQDQMKAEVFTREVVDAALVEDRKRVEEERRASQVATEAEKSEAEASPPEASAAPVEEEEAPPTPPPAENKEGTPDPAGDAPTS